MADIDIERKGPSIWPWIIGLIVLALLIWLLMEMFTGDRDEAVVDQPVATEPVTGAPDPLATDTAGAAAMPPTVQTYLAGCTQQMGAPEGDMGQEHEYTVRCLRQLRDAIDEVARQDVAGDVEIQQRLEDYGQAVQDLEQSDPASTQHANLTRRAATTGADVLEAMQDAWFAGEDRIRQAVSQAAQSAEGIDTGTAMLEQSDAIRGFFRDAGQALQMMAERPARR